MGAMPSAPAAPSGERHLKLIARASASATAALSAASIAGWAIHSPGLEALFLGSNPVSLPPACALLLCGFSLFFASREPAPRPTRAAGLAALAAAVYSLVADDRRRAAALGHMTFLSALVLALVALALCLSDLVVADWRPSNVLAAAAWAFSLLALVSHLYGARLLRGGFDMALPAALIFLILCSGLLTGRRGLIAGLLVEPGPGGVVLRRFFPAAILVPVFLGWLRVLFSDLFLQAGTGAAALSVTIAAVFGLLVIQLALRIDREAAVSERRRAYFDTAVNSVKDYAIFLLDAEGRIQTWNDGARIINDWTAEEIVGRPLSMLYPPEDAERRVRLELEAAAREGRYEDEGWRARKDGSLYWAGIVLTALRDERGRVTGFLKVARDMTERRRQEAQLKETLEKLQRSNQELEQFAYVASHDLQEPLRKVTSFTQLFAKRYASKVDATAAGYIGYIVDGAQRMQNLITDLLAFSRLGSQPRLVETDLGEIARQAVTEFELAIKDSGAKVEIEALPRVSCDPGRMLQLFENLLGNALKFRGAERSIVRIFAQRGDGGWTVSVADNGIGIEPQYHDQIFAMFRRLHSRSEYPGTGIGLAICKRVVEQLGGRIWVESRPAKGSTFRFTIPEARKA